MYLLYSLLLSLGFLALTPRFLFDVVRHGKYAAGFGERMGRLPRAETGGRKVIWLHCVSVGEAQAARPLARALCERFPSHALVVSTVTRTGQQVAREVFAGEAAFIFYFPFDWAWTVRRALARVRPSAVVIMETELWPRFLRECQRARVPVALVNGRISDNSFRRYRLIRRFISRVVSDLTLAVVQTEADAARLSALGLSRERIKVSGNVKFDAAIDASELAVTSELRARFGFDKEETLIVAASTHAPEERILLEALQLLRSDSSLGRVRLLIAPRHPERFPEVATLLASSGFQFARRTALPDEVNDTRSDIILLDSIGELRGTYPLASLVFVGGSIAPTGGHNVLEPAQYARCVVTGAHTFNFKAIVGDFLARDALVQLSEVEENEAARVLAGVCGDLLRDEVRREAIGERARAALEESRGATARTVEMLAPVIELAAGQPPESLPLRARAQQQ